MRWIRVTLASHKISRNCLIDYMESSVELVGLSLEGNVARGPLERRIILLNLLLYEFYGAHTCFLRRYCLWLRPEKVLGRAFLKSIIFG